MGCILGHWLEGLNLASTLSSSSHITMNTPTRALSLTAFLTLLLIAFMMGANHVAARIAFAQGLDVATAVAVRSLSTAAVVGVLLWSHKVSLQ